MESESPLNQKRVCSDERSLDRLNHLPEEVINVIFKHVPLQDVVRTSVLSKKWRFKWRSISDLVFRSLSPSRAYIRNGHPELARIVDHILMLHNGRTISRFEIFYWSDFHYADVDRLIFLLEKKSVEQLILHLRVLEKKLYTFSSYFFSLQHLNLLSLSDCELKLPYGTEGFPNLTILHLEEVTLTDGTIASLISSSSFLKDLSLIKCTGFTCLSISAPNLTKFFFRGRCGDIMFESTMRLENAYIEVKERTAVINIHETDSLEDILGSFVNIQKLYISKHFMEMLTVYVKPESLPLTYDNLRSIELSFTFKDPKEFSIALCLLGSSPYLEEMKITSFYDEHHCLVDEDFWKQYKFNLPKLRTVKLLQFNGDRSEMMFVKFILNSAMVLKTFNIQWDIGSWDQQYTPMWYQKRLSVVETVNTFYRASPRAAVMFED